MDKTPKHSAKSKSLRISKSHIRRQATKSPLLRELRNLPTDRFMWGELNKLPDENSRTIRVFISSTFSGLFRFGLLDYLQDLALERNFLMKQSYPRLKTYCREEHGYEFQVSGQNDTLLNSRQLICVGVCKIYQFWTTLAHKYAMKKFLDLQPDKQGCVDATKYDRSQRLIEEVLPSLLPSSNLRVYTVPWEAIERDGPQRNRYLHKFGMDFEAKLRAMIDRSVEKKNTSETDETRNEVRTQLRLCADCVKSFQGRHDLLDAIRSYIIGDSTEPLVLYGTSGSGKSSLLAQAATLSRGWVMESSTQPASRKSPYFTPGKWGETLRQIMATLRFKDHGMLESREIQTDAIIIVRFLGTSPLNSSIVQTLKCKVTNLFYDLLTELSNRNQWVVIFLDAIDQLDPSDAAYQVNWLRSPLPDRVRFVLSTLSDFGGILMALKSRLAPQLQATDINEVSPEHQDYAAPVPSPLLLNPRFFVLVSQLDVNVCMQVLFTSLKTSDRALRPFQYRLVRRAFEHCQLSIFVELVTNKVCLCFCRNTT
ncbi:unnamed protein product [Schistocephalus solidus]|uniref:AAA_16 domain-containing protein n=1 Tax=Schistocephalus solidus TaxID=70667 RepID=A0A183TL06_SCHSO|nr:unnamed protein product [Schistocephalus solidus]